MAAKNAVLLFVSSKIIKYLCYFSLHSIFFLLLSSCFLFFSLKTEQRTFYVPSKSKCCFNILFFSSVFLFGVALGAGGSSNSGTVIGIDLGTTYSCVGVLKNGHVDIIANDQGNRITPSWVGFTNTDRLIGEAAKNQAPLNGERTVFDVKRLIGRK